MKNPDLLIEYINRVIQAADRANKTSKKLRSKPISENFDKLESQMQEITEHLSTLQSYLAHQDDFVLDEFSDWLSSTITGKHLEYRHSPRLRH